VALIGKNKCLFIGYLGEDPVLRTYNEGKDNEFNVVKSRMGCSERRPVKGKKGEWEDHSEWITFEVYGNDAKFLAKYGKKGSLFIINEAKARTDSWIDEEYKNSKGEGCKKYATVYRVAPGESILPKIGSSASDAPEEAPESAETVAEQAPPVTEGSDALKENPPF
jgi:single-stranded DNA-binding protein